jgi:hypothetical protein
MRIMARGPDWRNNNNNNNNDGVRSREELKEITRSLSLFTESGVRDFYERAYRECAIVNSRTFPPARAIHELVQAWKQLRKWRR